jgi:hypothetical protein
LECAGDIVGDTNRLLQPLFATETLRAFDGELHGGLRFGPGKKTDDVVMNWSKPTQYLTWSVRINEPVTYEVFANYDADAGSEGNSFTVTFAGGNEKAISVSGQVKTGKQQTQSLGRIQWNRTNEPFEIKVAAEKIKGDELFRLRRLELRPIVAPQPASAK